MNSEEKYTGNFRIALAIGILSLSYYVLILGGHHYSIDGVVTFQAARVLVAEKSLSFHPPIRWGRQVIHSNKYGPGMTVLYVPLVFAARTLDPELLTIHYDPEAKFDWRLMQNDLYTYCSILNPILSSLVIVVLFFLVLEIGLKRIQAVAVGLVTALASPFAPYARFDFSQPLIVLILLLTLLLVLRAKRQSRPWFWIAAGCCICYGFLTRPDFLLFVPWIYALAFFDRKGITLWNRIKPLLLMIAPALLGASVYVAMDRVRIDSLLQFGLFGFDLHLLPYGFSGQLISPGKGLFLYFPLSLLAILGFVEVYKFRKTIAITFAGMILTALLVYSSWGGWWGGWSWGPRFLIPIVPIISFFAFFRAAQHWSNAAERWTFLILLAAGLLVSFNGIFFDFVSFYVRFASIGNPDSPYVNFLIESSPLLSGWNLKDFDLLWILRFAQGSTKAALVMLIATFVLVISSLWLWKLLSLRLKGFSSARVAV